MITISTIDEAIKNELVQNGGKVMSEQRDINGKYIWTIRSEQLCFSADDERYKGRFKLVSNPVLFY